MSAAQSKRTKDPGISLNNWILLVPFLQQIKLSDSEAPLSFVPIEIAAVTLNKML